MLPYTMGSSVKTNSVFTNEYTFQNFVDKFKIPKELNATRSQYTALNKAGRGRLKAPNRYVMPGYAPKGVRNRQGVMAVTMLCIDVDVPKHAEFVAGRLKDCAYNHWAYPTLSSGVPDVETHEAGLRLRIFVETDGSVSTNHYEVAVLTFLYSIGVSKEQVDPASFRYWHAMFLPLDFKSSEGWSSISEEYGRVVFGKTNIDEKLIGEVVVDIDEDAEAFGDDEYLQRFADMPPPAKEGEVLKALASIPPDIERGSWIKIGKALYNQYQGSKEGLNVWNEWSEDASNYVSLGDLEKDWRSFKSSAKNGERPITISSIFYIAKEYGWAQSNVIEVDFSRVEDTILRLIHLSDNSEFITKAIDIVARCTKAVTASVITEAVLKECKARDIAIGKAAFNKDVRAAKSHMTRAKIDEGGGIESDLPLKRAMRALRESHRCIAKSEPLLFYSIENGTYLPDKQFVMSNLDEIRTAMVKAGYDVDTGVIEKCKDAVSKVIPKVDGMDFAPDEDVLFESGGQTYVNTYNPSTVPQPLLLAKEADKAAIKRLEKHFRMLVSIQKDRTILLDFLANLVQNPHQKCNWAILLQGGKGIGKSYIGELMRRVLGGPEAHKYTTILSDSSKFESRFNSWAEGIQLVVVNEMRLKNASQAAVDSAKTLITDTSISIERKRQDVRVVKNTASYLFFTNDHDAIRIEMGDRRFCIIFSDIQRKEQVPDSSYFKALFEDLENHPAALVKYFHDYKISESFDAKGYAPFTTSKAVMAETGANYKDRARMAISSVVKKLLERKYSTGMVYSAVILHYLEAEYSDELELERKSVQAITKDVTTILAELGYFRVKIVGRAENRVYYKKDGVKRFSAMYSADIRLFESGIECRSPEYGDMFNDYKDTYDVVDALGVSDEFSSMVGD